MSFVFVVDQDRKPLDPVHPGRARYLLTAGHAAVLRRYPFTLIMHESKPDALVQPLRLKIDPSSQTTGLAVINDATGQVLWAAEVTHRGEAVKEGLQKRANSRRGRRYRHTRYRPARYANRTRPKGWLPPSLKSRIHNVETWVSRLRRWCPIQDLSLELVRFDTQLLQNPEIAGVEYQQGTLAGYEVREYLLLKWGHTCAYCQKTDAPLQMEHIVPKARGGTKWNRSTRSIPKTHWLDAACVGASTPASLLWQRTIPFLIKAQGRHNRQMCLVDKRGFPRTKAKGPSQVFGFQTGDMVKAIVPKGKPQGVHVGKVAVKASGYFTITTAQGKVPDVAARYCQPLHRSDGYSYQKGARAFPPIP